MTDDDKIQEEIQKIIGQQATTEEERQAKSREICKKSFDMTADQIMLFYTSMKEKGFDDEFAKEATFEYLRSMIAMTTIPPEMIASLLSRGGGPSTP